MIAKEEIALRAFFPALLTLKVDFSMVTLNQETNKVTVLSLVVSVFNEEAVLTQFIAEAVKHLGELPVKAEYIFVNDGSSDNSYAILKEASMTNRDIKVINLSKNFGHEAAMIAGIDHSSGDAVICIDADLQHPLEKIGEMFDAYCNGYEIVSMVRVANRENTLFKNITSRLFYNILNLASPQDFEPNASDYFLISQRVASILKHQFRERIRFLRGYVQVIGFKKTRIEYIANRREGGESKYSLKKLVVLSVNAIFSFSNLPLRLGILVGSVVGMFAFLITAYSIVMKLRGNPPTGYTTIVVLISFLFSIQFLLLGIIGEYIGYIFMESQKRPIYLVDTSDNCSLDTHAP